MHKLARFNAMTVPALNAALSTGKAVIADIRCMRELQNSRESLCTPNIHTELEKKIGPRISSLARFFCTAVS